MKKIFGLVLAGLIAFGGISYGQEKDAVKNQVERDAIALSLYEKADLLRRSAEKSRTAAVTHQSHAAQNRKTADNFENSLRGPSFDRTADYRNAGGLLIKSGDSEISAARDYAVASSNLTSAIGIYKNFKYKDIEKLEKLLGTDMENVERCFYQALDDYAKAEEDYSELYGNDLEKQAAANEKSAKCLETLAGRK
ncbi:Uncharacterised protein [uncultured archaeon]|nr:Uncharacterised protein [uncultured archaeon]